VNDDNEFSEIRESLLAEGADLAGVHMARPAEAVMAKGQALRLRRRLLRGLSGVTAAGAAMALALGLSLGGTSAGIRQVHVTEADWSVNTGQNGTVIVRVRMVSDPLRLQSVLAQAGVPATVRWGQRCVATGWGLPGKNIVEPRDTVPVILRGVQPSAVIWTIHPARIPAHKRFVVGSWLRLVYGHPQHSRPVVWALIPASAHLSCIKKSPGVAIWSLNRCGGSPSPSAPPSPYSSPSPSPQPSCTPSPHPTSSPHGTPSPHPTSSPHGTPSPHPTSSPHPTPSPHGTMSP